MFIILLELTDFIEFKNFFMITIPLICIYVFVGIITHFGFVYSNKKFL